MSSTATAAAESLLIGEFSSPTTDSVAPIICLEFSAAPPASLANTTSLTSLLSEYESDPEMARHLADARRNIARTFYADEPETLSALRLAAGFSQTRLAEGASTYQSYIARLELGQADPSTDMISKIATALGVEADRVFRAITNQRSTRGQSN